MIKISRIVLLDLLAYAWKSVNLNAQEHTFHFDLSDHYDNQITSPADFPGYEAGEACTLHSGVVDYFRNLAEESGRVTLQTYGET